jgi:hypothetical protein
MIAAATQVQQNRFAAICGVKAALSLARALQMDNGRLKEFADAHDA